MAKQGSDASLQLEIQRLKQEIATLRRAADERGATKSELELRGTIAVLEEAQSMARLGSWRYDPEAQQAHWSAEFRRVADLPSDLPANVNAFLNRIVEDERDTFTQRCVEILNDPRGGQIEGRLRRSNGEVRHIRLQGSMLIAADGRKELRGILLDVTDHVRLREELAQAQRTEAIGRLAAGVAHDFNNLLTIAIGNLELAAEKSGSSQELEECMMALDSATNLTRRLLAFGRRAQLTLTIVDLNELVRSTLKLMRRLLGDHIQLEAALEKGVLPVRVDPLEVERALVNLVLNARDVTPNGGLVRLMTATRRAQSCDWIDVTITDEGPGIRDTDLAHIFEPFYTTKERVGGTGLGLATVLGTAEQHGGSVQVQTEIGKGSSFTVSLPAAKLECAAPPSRAASKLSPPSSSQSHRILVVDDEPMVAETCRRMLIARGHWVHVATSPEEALGIWSEHAEEFDLVICDVIMPNMRGPELVKSMAKVGTTPRVLFISGYNEDPAVAASGHQVLFKPFTSPTLRGAVDRVMKEYAGAG